MNIVIFEIRKNIKSIVAWSGILVGLIFLFMCMFPSMKNNDMMDLVNAKVDSFPPVVLEMFNISEMPNFSNIVDYFAYSFQFVLMAIGIYGGIIGSGLLSNEEREGTIEFLYSKPITRKEIVLKKFLAGILIFSMFLIIVWVGSMISIAVFGENTNLDAYKKISEIIAGSFIVGLIFLVLGLVVSMFLKNTKSSVQLGLGLFFGTYMLGVLSKLNENIEGLKYISPYEMFIPANIVKHGLDYKYLTIAIILVIIGVGIVIYKYNRRDFHI